MLVTKYRKGYTIKCTHSDFEMLRALIRSMSADAQRQACTGYARKALSTRTRYGEVMRVDIDKSRRPYGPTQFQPQ